MSKQRVHQMIETAEAASKMSKIFDLLPTRESHVRELLKLQDDGHRAEVWRCCWNR